MTDPLLGQVAFAAADRRDFHGNEFVARIGDGRLGVVDLGAEGVLAADDAEASISGTRLPEWIPGSRTNAREQSGDP